MLTAIEIENFKAFGDRQRIELAPLTLLFGPNSGGKSSIIHALHYAREIMLGRGCDVHRTESGADLVDLGGFSNLVHGHDPNRTLTLSFEMTGCDLANWTNTVMDDEIRTLLEGEDDDEHELLDGLGIDTGHRLDQVETIRITLEINQSSDRVSRYMLAFDDRPVATIETLHGRAASTVTLVSELFDQDCRDMQHNETGEVTFEVQRLANGMPEWDHLIETAHFLEKLAYGQLNTSRRGLIDGLDHEEDRKNQTALGLWLTRLLTGPGAILADELAAMRYIGPWRTIPSRLSEPPAPIGPSKWPSGTAAWQLLMERKAKEKNAEGTSLIDSVNSALENSDTLDTGYRVKQERRVSIESEVLERLLARAQELDEENTTDDSPQNELMKEAHGMTEVRVVLEDLDRGIDVQPPDVGVGISQVLPVVVASLDHEGAGLVAMEQPELHLHPRQQAALGDVLIRGIGYKGSSRPEVLEPLEREIERMRLLESACMTYGGDRADTIARLEAYIRRWIPETNKADWLKTTELSKATRPEEGSDESNDLGCFENVCRDRSRVLEDLLTLCRKDATSDPRFIEFVMMASASRNKLAEEEDRMTLTRLTPFLDEALAADRTFDHWIDEQERRHDIPSIPPSFDFEFPWPSRAEALNELFNEEYVRPRLHAKSDLRNLIVETHSEHLILRILRRIRETGRGTVSPGHEMTPRELSVLYTQQGQTTGSEVRRIHVDVDGEFVEPWPDKFFDQDSEERFG